MQVPSNEDGMGSYQPALVEITETGKDHSVEFVLTGPIPSPLPSIKTLCVKKMETG